MADKHKQKRPPRRRIGLAWFRRQPPKSTRQLIGFSAFTVILLVTILSFRLTQLQPKITPDEADVVLYTTASCGCYRPWVSQLTREGLAVSVVRTTTVIRKQAQLGVPREFSACHTAAVNGYWLEGHVPAESIQQLLDQKPEEIGGIAHLRAQVQDEDSLLWEVVTYDRNGLAVSSAPDSHQLRGQQSDAHEE